MATITKVGYGQVEPNHLSAQGNRQIYAQLPAATAITALQNGQFVKYDMAAGECNFTGDGEFMLVYNEEKVYDYPRKSRKDFQLAVADSADGKIYPRCFKTAVGDIFTTNLFAAGADLAVGDKVAPGTDGLLKETTETAGMLWKVVKLTTMPDGQAGIKLQRIQ